MPTREEIHRVLAPTVHHKGKCPICREAELKRKEARDN